MNRRLAIVARMVIFGSAMIDLIGYSTGHSPSRWQGIILSAACAVLTLNPLPPRPPRPPGPWRDGPPWIEQLSR